MIRQKKFSILDRLKSFRFAFNGIKILFREEHNSIIHLISGICALIAGFVLNISLVEWIAIVFAIGLVLTLEIINSSIENIADFISAEQHEKIKKIKDLSAAGVLTASITALIIGLIVFIPKILNKC
jgi:diacylglycerol kinase